MIIIKKLEVEKQFAEDLAFDVDGAAPNMTLHWDNRNFIEDGLGGNLPILRDCRLG